MYATTREKQEIIRPRELIEKSVSNKIIQNIKKKSRIEIWKPGEKWKLGSLGFHRKKKETWLTDGLIVGVRWGKEEVAAVEGVVEKAVAGGGSWTGREERSTDECPVFVIIIFFLYNLLGNGPYGTLLSNIIVRLQNGP